MRIVNMKRFLALMMVIAISISWFAGCNLFPQEPIEPNNPTNPSEPTENTKPDENFFVITDPTKNTYVVQDGVSAYRILIPENATDKIQFAASELQYFFELITGVELEIVDTAEDLQGKYYSLGNTEILQASGVTATYAELGMDGYRVKTYGDAIVMAGENDVSTCYAVYGYLAKQFGLEIYAEDIYRIYNTKNAKLLDIDWTDLPDIPFRNGGTTPLSWYTSQEYMTRMRYRNMEEFWGLNSHSYFVILPPSKYLSAHPDWYNSATNPNEICKTNQEMVDQFVENLKQIILDRPNHRYFMLGHEDGSPYCGCSDCNAVRNQYKGSNSALEVLFTNEVVRRINEWAAKTIPDRELFFGMFAYTTTEEPPVEYDAATGTYYPINHDEKLMLEHNIGIMIAPIGSQVSDPYLEQSYTGRVFKGWDAISDNLFVWSYGSAGGNTIAPFDGFGSYSQNFKDFKNMGALYVFIEGSHWSGLTPNFDQLRDWLCSKLMWDTSLDTETLVRDFMKHYYGPGWESMYEFFTLWRARMTELKAYGMLSYTAMAQNWAQKWYYSKGLLDQYDKLFDDAILANEALKETDPEMYVRYRDNLRLERCLVRYLILSIYIDNYDKDICKAMIDEFKEITGLKNVNGFGSNSLTADILVAQWQEKAGLVDENSFAIQSFHFSGWASNFVGDIHGQHINGVKFLCDIYQPTFTFTADAVARIQAFAAKKGFDTLRIKVTCELADNGLIVAGNWCSNGGWATVDIPVADLGEATIWSQSQGITEIWMSFEFINRALINESCFTSFESTIYSMFTGNIGGKDLTEAVYIGTNFYQPTFKFTEEAIATIQAYAVANDLNTLRCSVWVDYSNNGFYACGESVGNKEWKTVEISVDDLADFSMYSRATSYALIYMVFELVAA